MDQQSDEQRGSTEDEQLPPQTMPVVASEVHVVSPLPAVAFEAHVEVATPKQVVMSSMLAPAHVEAATPEQVVMSSMCMLAPAQYIGSQVHVEVAAPVLKLSLWLTAILGALCIGGGIVAIIWNSLSPTQINILGMTVTTGHVGVAFTALGVISLIICVRSVNKNLYRLAALPRERKPRRR